MFWELFLKACLSIATYCLSGSGLLLLRKDVELVEVGLDVAVSEGFTFLYTKYLAHCGIRVDGVTLLSILELVAVDIGAEGASDISRGHLSTLGFTEERAELILEGHRGSEDSRALLLRGTIFTLLLGAAAALASLLDLLGYTLL